MAVFDSSIKYIMCSTDLRGKITRMEAIIDALELKALSAAEGDDVSVYSLDDGQTKIMTTYRSVADIQKSLQAFIKMKEYYVNKLNKTSMVRLVDQSNFRGRNYGR